MKFNEEVFLSRYNKLNPQQKEAVDTVYGPVMVIAGPGTGKTEVLSMRIAALLRSEVQVKPFEILCLTFTEEGSVAMRRRLLQIIGEDAHKVHIFTFHAFCNHIIQANPDAFGLREVMPISDLERMDMLYNIIEELPEGHALRRLKGDIFYDAKNLKNLFDLMKSEDWSPEIVSDAIGLYLDDLPNRDKYIYQRANPKKNINIGDPKTDLIKKEAERMERTRAAAQLFPEYQRRMAAAGRYDFNDMILWVLKAFREKPDFLQIQQERFQFILVDEFQDTSGAQNELIMMLSDFWEDPNLFIVGDDDQSIFEFQGARLQNIIDFYRRYQHSIKVIILKENYRSSQHILDRSTQTIKKNQQRLIAQIAELGLDKDIVSANERFSTEATTLPVVVNYFNHLHEEADIVAQLEELHRSGVPLNNAAVLYAQHKQAENIIALLEKKGLPYWVKRPVNVLDLPLINQLLNIMRYLDLETTKSFDGEELLFQLLHTPFFGVSPLDVASLSIYLQTKDNKHKYWRYLLQDTLFLETTNGLVNAPALYRLGQNLDKWMRNIKAVTLPMLLEDILYDSGIVAYLIKGSNQVWDMQVLNTFFDFVKEECTRRPRTSVRELLAMLERMDKEGIPISIQKVMRQENGVRFYTAFSAKGHEFEHVFLVGATRNFWEAKAGNNRGFSLPDTLTKIQQSEEENKNSIEVARRLFYVAMTRAKKHLHISFAQKDNKEKELEPSLFIDEISLPEERQNKSLDNASIVQHLAQSFMPNPVIKVEVAQKELLDRRLENFVLSVSAMNKYLNCPLSFYYEYVLRVPSAKSDALSFGIAVHYALEQLFKRMDPNTGQLPTKEDLIVSFKISMRREEGSFTRLQYDRRLELGERILGEYYDKYAATFPRTVISEYNVSNASVKGVPIKGKLDKIEFDGRHCVVIDYKTGSPDYSSRNSLMGPSDASPNGGDYWRQMVFYKILLENYAPARDWQMLQGVFDFIEKNKNNEFVRYTVPIADADVTTVKQQIKTVYDRIMAHEFDTGCGEENCHWCNFAKTYELTKPVVVEEVE